MFDTNAFLIMLTVSLVTVVIRFLPFLLFGQRRTPAAITYLGRVLPYAIMGMLVVFCRKGVSLTVSPHGIPDLAAIAVVVALHLWKRQTLLSIVGGTVCYMLLVQFVF